MQTHPAIDRSTITILDAHGTSRHVGRTHGEHRRDAIASALDVWKSRLAETLAIDPDAAITRFLADTNFLPAIERHTPDLLDEVRGIAEGANQSFDTILAYNLLDEAWEWVGAQLKPGCTSCGVREGGVPVIAQNMDIPDVHDGTQTVLRASIDGKPSVMVLTYAGMIGLMGCNADGVGVVVNNLQVLPVADDALPVAFIMRGILQQPTLAAAATFVTSVPHAIGQHYAIGSPEGLRAFEGCGAGVVELPADATRYVHANHPLGDTPVRMET
ncbi:MAG: C45 family autoproteolytic acyltransferase/hydrolase, partial [Chloroflexota bacterium]